MLLLFIYFFFSGSFVLREYYEKLTYHEAKNILENAEASKIISLPPQNPKDGSVYVLQQNSRNNMDYVADGFSWKNFGSHKLPRKEPIIRVRYYHRKVKKELVDFKKYLYEPINNVKKRVLIHYLGRDDFIIQEADHGNRVKNKERGHYRTMPSVLQKLKESSGSASNVYKKLVSDPFLSINYEKVSKPRNIKQITNAKYNTKIKSHVDSCEIYYVLQINNEIEEYGKNMCIIPHVRLTLIHSKLIRDIDRAFTEDKKPNIISYDTTFNLGDFYVSSLIVKHPLFQERPAIPVAIMLHHRRTKQVHEAFLREVLDAFPILNSGKILFVSDREVGIVNAAKEVATSQC